MEICFDDDEVEEEFHRVWSDFERATNDASPILPQIRDWKGGAPDPDCSSSLHD
jgi:hypothetical protein